MTNTYNLLSNLEFILSDNNLSKEDLGKSLGGISAGAVRSWLNGKTIPPLVKMIALAEKYNVSIQDLIFGDLSNRKKGNSNSRNETIDRWRLENDPTLAVKEPETFAKYAAVELNESLFEQKAFENLLVFVAEHEDEFMKYKIFENLIEKRVAKKIAQLSKSTELFFASIKFYG